VAIGSQYLNELSVHSLPVLNTRQYLQNGEFGPTVGLILLKELHFSGRYCGHNCHRFADKSVVFEDFKIELNLNFNHFLQLSIVFYRGRHLETPSY
jgi:hypothetical protein